MSALQAVTQISPHEVYGKLDEAQRTYIDFCAVNGLVMDEAGGFKQMTVQQLADSLGVSRQAFYHWRTSIPFFGDMVAGRRKTIFSETRIAAVWKGVLLRAAKGDAQQAQMVLSHFGDYTPPTQKVDASVEIKGLAELVQRAQSQGIIEGEIVDAGTSSQNIPARTEAS